MEIKLGPSTSLIQQPEAHLTLNDRNNPFVNHVIFLCVIFDKNYMEIACRND
jgi:hypothetical protein